MKEKIKIGILLGAEFLAIAIILLLIFFAGKKSYTVTFDLDGGTLIAGDIEQRITQGHDANPPQAAKAGHYFLKWSGSYKKITGDVTLKAIWEYETTPGIEYADAENANYTEIVGAFKHLNGDVYIGAYHNEIKVLGIRENAFADCKEITAIYLLDGILRIESGAFQNCIAMENIDLPETTTYIGDYAFAGCESLTEVVLPEDLKILGDFAFANCTSLERIVIPEGVTQIGENAFAGCESLTEVILPETLEKVGADAFTTLPLTIYICAGEEDSAIVFEDGWCAKDTTLIFGQAALDYVASLKDEKEPALDKNVK